MNGGDCQLGLRSSAGGLPLRRDICSGEMQGGFEAGRGTCVERNICQQGTVARAADRKVCVILDEVGMTELAFGVVETWRAAR